MLLLARSFPPVSNIATIRQACMARYLARAGWTVTVLCPARELLRDRGNQALAEALANEPGIEIRETGYMLRSLVPGLILPEAPGSWKLVGGLSRKTATLLDIDDGVGWIQPILSAVHDLEPGDVDLVLASGSPFGSYMAANLLGKRLKCPYVLDYRDPWALKYLRTTPVRPWTRWLEKRICNSAAAIIHVSSMLIEGHAQAFGGREKIHEVTNGYDPDLLDPVEPIRFGHRAIVYAGRFYPPNIHLRPVLSALAELHADPGGRWRDVRVHYYGSDTKTVLATARECGVEHVVVCHGKVSQTEAFAAVKGATVASVVVSVFDSVPQEMAGVVTGKVFEALGLGVQILLIAPEGSKAREILLNARAGIACSGASTPPITQALKKLLDEPAEPDWGARAEFAWPQMVNRLDLLLRAAAFPGSSRTI